MRNKHGILPAVEGTSSLRNLGLFLGTEIQGDSSVVLDLHVGQRSGVTLQVFARVKVLHRMDRGSRRSRLVENSSMLQFE